MMERRSDQARFFGWGGVGTRPFYRRKRWDSRRISLVLNRRLRRAVRCLGKPGDLVLPSASVRRARGFATTSVTGSVTPRPSRQPINDLLPNRPPTPPPPPPRPL